MGELPAVGADVLLRGCEAGPGHGHVFEVAATGVGGEPALCELRPLAWDQRKARVRIVLHCRYITVTRPRYVTTVV